MPTPEVSRLAVHATGAIHLKLDECRFDVFGVGTLKIDGWVVVGERVAVKEVLSAKVT